MARLPDPYNVRPVASGVRPVARVRNAGAMGAAVADMGRGFQSLGSDLDAVVERQRQEEAAAAAADAEVAASARLRERLYDPEGGFLNTTGAAAVQGRQAVYKDLDTLPDEILKGLDPEAAKRLRPVLNSKIETAKRQVDIHTSQQRTNWLNSASEARVANAATDAVTRYGSPAEVNENINIAVAELKNRAEREGWPAERLEQEIEGTEAKVLRDVTVRMANAGDPAGAMEFARENADRLGAEMAYIEQVVLPEAKKHQGRSIADQAMSGQPGRLITLLDKTEGAGRYDTLFGHAQRPGGAFAGVDVTEMTIAELAEFTSPDERYAQYVKEEVGRVATPLGRGQIVGTTLRETAEEMGLSPDTKFTPAVQDAMIRHLAEKRVRSATTQEGKREALRQEWEGLKSASDAQLDAAIADIESGDGEPASDPLTVALAIEDPEVRDAAIARIDQVRRVEAAQETARRRAAQEQMFTSVEAGTDPRTLPLEVREAAGIDAVRAMESYYDQKSSGFAVRTDPELFAELMKEVSANPSAFAERDLLTYRDRLSEQDFRTMTEMKVKVDAGGSVEAVSFDHAHRVWRSAGIENGQPGSELSKRFAGLEVEFTREWSRFVEREKRQPTLAEQSQIASRVATTSGLEGTAQRLSRETAITASASELRSSAEPLLRAAELWQPKSEDERQTAAEFHSAHQREAQRFVERTGRQPTNVEAAQMAERMLLPFEVDPSGLLNKETRHAFEITLEDLEGVRAGETTLSYDGRQITLAEIQMAGRLLRQQGVADPTIPELLELIAGE